MLILSRKPKEALRLTIDGHVVTVRVERIKGQRVQLSIDGPAAHVMREEVFGRPPKAETEETLTPRPG